MKQPELFMLVYLPDQPVRAVFHGTLGDRQMEGIANELNLLGSEKIRLVILEKFRDGEEGYNYTILTLGCDNRDYLEERLDAVFPDATKVPLDKDYPLHQIVRSIIL